MTEVKIIETTEIVDQPLAGGLSRKLQHRAFQLINSASGEPLQAGRYELSQDGHTGLCYVMSDGRARVGEWIDRSRPLHLNGRA